jgi:hypothetical protein
MSYEEKDFKIVLDEMITDLTKEFPDSVFSFEEVLKDFWGTRYYLIKDGVRQSASLSMDSIMEAYYYPNMLIEYKAALKYEVNRENS